MDVLGAVTGTLGVLSLFSSCLEVFKYVQHGRNFGEEYDRRLDMFVAAKHRLLRWGESVAIHQNSRLQSSTEYNMEPVFRALRQLEQLFKKVKNCLEQYEIPAPTNQELTVVPSRHAPPSSLFSTFEKWSKLRKGQAQQRQKQTKMLKKAKWAILDAENFDSLLEKISFFLDFLESEERHLGAFSADHPTHLRVHCQWRHHTLEDPIQSALDEDSAAYEIHGRRFSAGGVVVSQPAPQPYFRSTQGVSSARHGFFNSNFDWGNSRISDTSSSQTPTGTLTDPTPVEDQVREEADYDFGMEQAGLPSSSRRVSSVELEVHQYRLGGTASHTFGRPRLSSADTISTAPPSSDWARRRDDFQLPMQPRRSTWVAPTAAVCTSEGFSSEVLCPVLEGANYFSSAVDGSRVAYLTSSTVHLFDTSQSSPLEAVTRYPLERRTWTGVAIAGSYLAVWRQPTSSAESLVGGDDRIMATGRQCTVKCWY
jgi:hypothetical protein